MERSEIHSAFFYDLYLFTKLCTPKQNLSKSVNVDVCMPAFEGGGTIACDGGWFLITKWLFCRRRKACSNRSEGVTAVKGFTYGENVATQQRTFRHEKSKIFRATFLRRKADHYYTLSLAVIVISLHKPMYPKAKFVELCQWCMWRGAGVRWTPLRSRSTDRGDSRDLPHECEVSFCFL